MSSSFKSFDFESNEDWLTYKKKLLTDNGDLTQEQISKWKKKWYKNKIDPSFDIEKYEREESAAKYSNSNSSSVPPSSNYSQSNYTNYNTNNRYSPPQPEPNLHDYINITIVMNYFIFFMLFILRSSWSVYLWTNCVILAIMNYGMTIYNEVKNYYPTSFTPIALQNFFAALTSNPNSLHFLYCAVIYHSQHYSVVAVLPIAIYAYLGTSQNFSSGLIKYLNDRFSHINLIKTFLAVITQLLENRAYLEYAAAAGEILTVPILFWRWLSGVSHDISLIDIFLLVRYINSRRAVSQPTQFILSGVSQKLRSIIPGA